jgi:hypothetical protein
VNDFLAAAVAAEERAGGTAVVASGDRDSFQLASSTTTILTPRGVVNSRAPAPKRSDNDMALIQSEYRTLLRLAVTL